MLPNLCRQWVLCQLVQKKQPANKRVGHHSLLRLAPQTLQVPTTKWQVEHAMEWVIFHLSPFRQPPLTYNTYKQAYFQRLSQHPQHFHRVLLGGCYGDQLLRLGSHSIIPGKQRGAELLESGRQWVSERWIPSVAFEETVDEIREKLGQET